MHRVSIILGGREKKNEGKEKKKREKFIFPFVGSLQFVILSISVYTGIINRKSVFIRNKYLTVACHAEIRNPHSNCQCGTYQKTCQSVSGLYHPRRRLGDVLLIRLQMPTEMMVNHLQHINNSLSCQGGGGTRYIFPPQRACKSETTIWQFISLAIIISCTDIYFNQRSKYKYRNQH